MLRHLRFLLINAFAEIPNYHGLCLETEVLGSPLSLGTREPGVLSPGSRMLCMQVGLRRESESGALGTKRGLRGQWLTTEPTRHLGNKTDTLGTDSQGASRV